MCFLSWFAWFGCDLDVVGWQCCLFVWYCAVCSSTGGSGGAAGEHPDGGGRWDIFHLLGTLFSKGWKSFIVVLLSQRRELQRISPTSCLWVSTDCAQSWRHLRTQAKHLVEIWGGQCWQTAETASAAAQCKYTLTVKTTTTKSQV